MNYVRDYHLFLIIYFTVFQKQNMKQIAADKCKLR